MSTNDTPEMKTLQVPVETHRRLKILSAELNTTITALAIEAVDLLVKEKR